MVLVLQIFVALLIVLVSIAAVLYLRSRRRRGDESTGIAERFRENFYIISGHLNWFELLPHLVEQGLVDCEDQGAFLDDKRQPTDKLTKLAKCLRKEKAYTKFLQCVRRAKEHLGHTYVVAILEGIEFATKEEREASQRLKDQIENNMTKMMDINLDELVPWFLRNELVTQGESTRLRDSNDTIRNRAHLLFDILNSKGPTAHLLFVQCLNQEHSHPTHSELYDVLTNEKHTEKEEMSVVGENKEKLNSRFLLTPWVVKPKSLAMVGPLRGRKYNQLMCDFKSYHHNGEWTKLELKAIECMQSESLEIRAVAHLEVGISWMFRAQSPSTAEDKVLSHVRKAQEICLKIEGVNADYLEARRHHILSALYRYLKNHEKAQEHAQVSVYLLGSLEHGEDSAFAFYVDACTKKECLTENSSPHEVEKVKNRLKKAYDDATIESEPKVVAYQALLRLAQVHLGSSQDRPAGSKRDPTSFREAKNCINWVKSNLTKVPERSKCLFYLTKSDYHRAMEEFDNARELARSALELASKCGFPREYKAAQSRLENS